MKIALGLMLALMIGVICRLAGIPAPAPPALVGSLLVLAMTSGYLLVDRYASQPARFKSHCGGPTGATKSQMEETP